MRKAARARERGGGGQVVYEVKTEGAKTSVVVR